MLEAGLYSLLTGDATLAALIGTRLFPVMVNEHDMPVNAGDPSCVSYQVVAGSTTYTLEPTQYSDRRIQFDIWSVKYSDSKSIAQAIRNVLSGYSGVLTDGTQVLSALQENEIDDFESDSRIFRVMSEYRIRFIEP